MSAVDARSAAAVLRELSRTAAARERVPALDVPTTWADLLFAAPGALRDPAEPSQALLATIAELYEGLAAHLSALPARARRHWLEDTLGIPRLPLVPDEVVAVATRDPAVPPVVLPRGTALRGGKAPAGGERTYLTTDVLTVLGAELAGAYGYRVEGARDRAATWADRAAPFRPFGGDPAEHRLDIVCDVLRFDGGSAEAVVSFAGVGADARLLAGGRWEFSTPDGPAPATVVSATLGEVRLALSGTCAPYDLDGEPATFLRVSFSGDTVSAATLAFATGAVTVHLVRTGVRPDAGFYNDGKLDVSKEFQPFGPVPRRGDSFYLRSDEAFGKPLHELTVTLSLLDEESGVIRLVDYAGPVQEWAAERLEEAYPGAVARIGYTAPTPTVAWQRHTGDRWVTYKTVSGRLTGGGTVTGLPAGVLSAEAEVAGVRGRFVRANLATGDFGWQDYLTRIARFAAAAAGPGDPAASDLLPPTPPTVSGVTIGYRTRSVTVTDLRSRNTPARHVLPRTGTRRPFTRPVEVTSGAAGAVTFGFTVDGAHLGSALSWYADVSQAPACESAGRAFVAAWEYWSDAGAWQPLDVFDGTSGLRQSGLVRLVAPADWAEGCVDVDADGARWLRLRTTTPDFVGDVLAVHVDAVTARYRSDVAAPARDLAPLTPLEPKQLKGLREPVAGVKVTNPVRGTPGRAAEDDAAYAARATAVVRHRDRALQAWDYESLVASAFPEVAVVRCLPHADANGCLVPGSVGLVVVPRSSERMPVPSVTLAERIAVALAPRLPVHARVVVLCPEYAGVRVDADVVLARGVAAAEARTTLRDAVDAFLHPLAGGGGSAPFGRALYASALLAFLESRPEVDHVRSFGLLAPHAGLDRVPVDACRGLVASGGEHHLVLREQL